MTASGRRWRLPLQAGNALLAAAIVIPLVLFALAAWQSYRATIEAAENRVERTARLLEEHALKVIETHQLIIEAVDERLRTIDWSNFSQQYELHRFLLRQQSELPQVGTITVVDADGRMRASSRLYPPDPTVRFDDRDWFQALKQSSSRLPYVSRVYTGRTSKLSVFNIAARAPRAADGGFGGAIAISVDRAYFEKFYATVETTFDHSVLLVRDDGEILAAEPPIERIKLKPDAILLTTARQAPSGAYEHTSKIDGVDRFFAYRKIGNFPIYVRFGIARDAALAPWRTTVVTYGIVAATTSLCLFVAGLLALRQTRRWRNAAAALEAEAEERERIEAQLRQVQKMEAVGQLTGGIAHDFNNMLSVIIGGLDLAQRRLERGDTDVRRFIGAAMEGATRAATLTNRLLAFSRQQPLSPAPLVVNDLIAGMSDMLRRTIGETIRLETVLAEGLWTSRADGSALENAIVNLAVNARDAMPDGGRLTIETANAEVDAATVEDGVPPGQWVLVTVADTGVGMAPDVAARAFDPFFTTKGVGKGTGLGLSQTYGFVKQSEGHIKIDSEPGRGTTFRIYLPRVRGAHDAAVPADREPGPDGIAGHAHETILVVEDEDSVRSISVDALSELGFNVIHASDASSALTLLREHPDVTLLFTDVVMPGMSGRELADLVAAERPDLKVLFATGYTRNAIVVGGVVEPGVQLITKPFSVEQLALKVRAVLDER